MGSVRQNPNQRTVRTDKQTVLPQYIPHTCMWCIAHCNNQTYMCNTPMLLVHWWPACIMEYDCGTSHMTFSICYITNYIVLDTHVWGQDSCYELFKYFGK